jgi:trehalose 6-phosphate phosphatase
VTEVAEAIAWLSAEPAGTALFTDFDGTLSRIVPRPEMAQPLPGAPEVLKRLAAQLRLVAVVSGRPAAWLVEQLGLPVVAGGPVVEAYGLHGLEHTSGGPVELAEGARAWADAAAEAYGEAVAARISGLEVEDKVFGVTLHWRAAPDPLEVSQQAAALAERLTARTGLLPRAGKASLELVAPIGIDKGSVVLRLGEGPGVERVAFFGDDVSDLPAFAAVDELVAGGGCWGLKIAVTGTEVPAELLERADLVLAAPEEALALLAAVADRLGGGA